MTTLRSILATLALLSAFTLPALAQRDVKAEEANRALVVEFYDRVFNRHEVAEGAKVIVDTYKQHNPNVTDGKAPFVNFFTERFKNMPEARSRIVRSVAQDDLVWLHIHATNNPQDRGRAIVDIFRVKDGMIVEHWDVVQPVPEKAANQNGMF